MPQQIEYEGTVHEFPDNFTDQDIARALKTYKPEAQAAATPTQKPGFLETMVKDIGGSFTSWAEHLNRGLEAAMRTSPGNLEWTRDPVTGNFLPKQVADPGTPLLRASELRANADYWKEQSAKLDTHAPKLEDISSFEDVMRFGSKAVLGNTTNMLTAVGTGAVSIVPTSIGEQYGNLQEKGVDDPGLATVAGAGVSVLEAITPFHIAAKLLGRAGVKQAERSLNPSVTSRILGYGKEGLVTGGEEAATESAQEVVGMAGESYAGVGPTAGEAASRLANAAAGGFLSGGATGAAFAPFAGPDAAPPPDPQVDQIVNGTPPTTPPIPDATEMFPLEDAEEAPSPEAPAAQPGQQPASAAPASAIEVNLKHPSQDLETYGDFTKDFEETSIGSVKAWRGPQNNTVVAETQDGRYQLSTKIQANETSSWVFPSLEQAAWVDANLRNLTLHQIDSEIKGLDSNQLVDYIYENARPEQAVIKSLSGDPIVVSNVDATLRHSNQRPLTYKQLDTIRANPRMLQLLTGLNDVATMFKDIFKTRGVSSDVSFMFSPEGANYGYNQVADRKISVNLATDVLQNYPPEGFAVSLVETLVHEYAHDLAANHLPEFSRAQKKLTGAALEQYEANAIKYGSFIKESYATPYLGAIDAIRQLVADPASPQRIDPRILSTLRGLSRRSGQNLSREGDAGQSFEQLISGEPQEQMDASGGNSSAIQPRPVVTDIGGTLAAPVWFSRLGNALFGPTGVFGNAKQLSKQQLLAIANNPERYGVRPDEIKWTGMKVWLEGASAKVSREEVEDWFERHQVRVEEEVRPFVAPTKYDAYVSPGPTQGYGEVLMIWRGAEYSTPHFHANEIVHARFNVRETPQGRVLFIEEVQSDWHQKGREQGYRTVEKTRQEALTAYQKTLKDKYKTSNVNLFPHDFGLPSRLQQLITPEEFAVHEDLVLAANNERDINNLEYNKPPAAPFANSWHELALKRLIRWAAEQGLDGIAWTPSKMQVERYEDATRAVVDKVSWYHVKNYLIDKERIPVVSISARTRTGQTFRFLADMQGKIRWAAGLEGARNKTLQEVFGSDTANRILSESSATVSGAELTIGGEAFKILYDKEIPKFLEKYLKQWGVGLSKTEITTGFDPELSEYERENSNAATVSQSVPFFQFNSTMHDSVMRGQPLLRELPGEARVLGQHLARGIEQTGAVEDEVDKANQEQTHADMDKFSAASDMFATLLQIAARNPHIRQLQNFVEHLRELMAEKNSWKYEGEKILKDWNRLGKAQMSALGNFLFDVTAESDKLKRRLSIEELVELGKKHNLGEDAQRVYHQVDSTFRAVLTALRDVEMERVKQRLGAQNVDAWMMEQAKLNKEFQKIIDRNYFPYARFGNHVVLVTATKDIEYKGRKYRAGNTVHMSTYSSRREMVAMEKLAKREFAADGLHVGNRYLSDEVMAFQGFPSHLYQQVVSTLKLSEEQADLAKRFFLNLTPSQSFVQHLRKRRSIAGFSNDAQRVFSHYLSSAAGHVARAKHMDKLKADVAELKGSAKQAYMQTGQGERRDRLAEHVQKVLNFAENPGNDFALLRGVIFANYFAFVPAQALVNVTQLPMMTFPHLMVKYGVAKSAAAMVKAMKAVTGGFNFQGSIKWTNWNLDGNPSLRSDEKAALSKGIHAGFINESFAVEVASLSNGAVLESMLPHELRNVIGQENLRDVDRTVRDMVNLGIHPFRMSEEWNRRVAFLAAYNLERDSSGNEELAYREGRETIDQTMYEYAGWNRPLITRALGQKASVLFIFKSFMQSSLWYYMYGRGRMPALLSLALFAGLEGLPLVEDLNEILTTLLSGNSTKRTDPRKILRSYLSQIMDDPDIVMHGAARRSFGLGYLPGMPGWDLSPKIGMGRVVPGIAPMAQAARGEAKPTDAVARTMEEWLGVAGSMGMNAARAAVDFGPNAAQWKMRFYPNVIRNIVRTQQSVDQSAYTNAQGEPLVKFDQTDPTQLVEVFGQVLGLRSTAIAKEQEILYRASQEDAYYLARREHLMGQLESAFLASKRDPEAVAEGRRAIKHYNETMPPAYRLTVDQIITSLKTRGKNNALRERGLPTQARWRQLAQEWRSMYPTQ